jgi:hypothetical protein
MASRCFAWVALVPACQSAADRAEDFRGGVPTEESLTATMPGTGRALTIERASNVLQGATAESYRLTYGVTRIINGGALFVGGLVKAVLRLAPTSLSSDTAVWGPWTGDLEPVTWKLTITRVAEHQFRYSFDGQPRGNAAAPYVTVLGGTHTVPVDSHGNVVQGFGSGSFTLDWDARATLPRPRAREVGKAAYTYSHLPGAATTVGARFNQVLDENGRLVDLDYAYVYHDYAYGDQLGGTGSMDFVDSGVAQHSMAGGRWAVRSRWSATGAGRTDARATVDPLAGALTASECWSDSFASTFLVRSWEPAAGYGAEATDCTFTAAEHSQL